MATAGPNFQRRDSPTEILDTLAGISDFLSRTNCSVGTSILAAGRFFEERLPNSDGGYVIGSTPGIYGHTIEKLVWHPQLADALLDYSQQAIYWTGRVPDLRTRLSALEEGQGQLMTYYSPRVKDLRTGEFVSDKISSSTSRGIFLIPYRRDDVFGTIEASFASAKKWKELDGCWYWGTVV